MSAVQKTLPTIAILPGAWQSPENYQSLRQAFASRGYESICRSPPSSTLAHGNTDLNADIAFVREQILQPLIDQGREVVVVLHSFAGVYGGSAVKGLAKFNVHQAGKQGGVVALVYLAAVPVPSGISTLQMMGVGDDLVPWVTLDKSTGLLTMNDPASSLYHELPAGEAEKYTARMRPQALKPLQDVVPYAPFEDDAYKGHLAYLRCAKDACIHPSVQEQFAATAGIAVTEELSASHMPWLDMVESTVDKILEMVVKVRM